MGRIFLVIIGFFSLISCAVDIAPKNKGEKGLSVDSCANGIKLKYAEKFSVDSCPWGYRLNVFSDEEKHNGTVFYLVRQCCADSIKQVIEDPSIVVEIPLKRFASNSTTHLEFYRLLGVLPSLCAICNAEYIYSDTVYGWVKSGRIVELGNSMQVDVERLLTAAPEVLFLSDLREKPNVDVCSTIVCSEWKETTALGRAEWLKFFSLFFDRYVVADSIFNEIEKNYNDVKLKASKMSHTPTIFAGGCFGDTWYLTGGKGYMSALYEDANATYVLSDTLVGTVTCGLEWVLKTMKDVDVWMNSQENSRSALDARLSVLKSYKNEEIYNFNKRSVRRSAPAEISDFYEEAVAHPDWLLEDIVAVLHHSDDFETRYVKRLK